LTLKIESAKNFLSQIDEFVFLVSFSIARKKIFFFIKIEFLFFQSGIEIHSKNNNFSEQKKSGHKKY